MRARPLPGLLLSLALLALATHPAGAVPVCSDVPEAACGGRIFAEPAGSATFLQHDLGEYADGIGALAARFPRFVKVTTLASLLDDPAAVSAGGRDVWVVEITDFEAPEEGKLPVTVSLSVHGAERAGLEGGARYAEDLARWATDDPAHLLRNGTEPDSVGIPVGEALRRVHLYLADINPDGWAAGDLANGGVFVRGNENGVDLNREFPTLGWTKRSYTPLSEPESIAWSRFVEQVGPATAADLHGELTSVNDAFADMMYPAAQWNPLRQAQEERLARHMRSNVYRYFDEQGVVLGDVAGAAAGMRPADYATAYDVVGYDDSGFMGDFFAQSGALEIDVEHFLSHQVPNSTWLFPLEQAHVAAVRAEIETLVVEAIAKDDFEVSLDLGAVGYLFDPTVVTDADGAGPPPPPGVTPEPYAVTPMRYFEDLSAFATEPLRRVAAADLAGDDDPEVRGDLEGLDSLVIVSPRIPEDPAGRAVDEGASIAALRAFVEGGGNLILTDGALDGFLPALGIVDAAAVRTNVHNAGHIDIEDFEDAYTAGLHTTASQTYYEVPLGYSVDGNHAPHWTVDRTAWEAAGGTTVATIGGSGRVGLGRAPLGAGTVGIVGALLPPQSEQFDHYFGLADYAVTVAGGQILDNMLALGAA